MKIFSLCKCPILMYRKIEEATGAHKCPILTYGSAEGHSEAAFVRLNQNYIIVFLFFIQSGQPYGIGHQPCIVVVSFDYLPEEPPKVLEHRHPAETACLYHRRVNRRAPDHFVCPIEQGVLPLPGIMPDAALGHVVVYTISYVVLHQDVILDTYYMLSIRVNNERISL